MIRRASADRSSARIDLHARIGNRLQVHPIWPGLRHDVQHATGGVWRKSPTHSADLHALSKKRGIKRNTEPAVLPAIGTRVLNSVSLGCRSSQPRQGLKSAPDQPKSDSSPGGKTSQSVNQWILQWLAHAPEHPQAAECGGNCTDRRELNHRYGGSGKRILRQHGEHEGHQNGRRNGAELKHNESIVGIQRRPLGVR